MEPGRELRQERGAGLRRAGFESPSYRCEPAAIPSIEGVHGPICSIWDVPAESAPEALWLGGMRDEAAIAYLAEVRLPYDAAKRCIGQLSGVLLLLQTDSLERDRDAMLLASVALQLNEASARLDAVEAPAVAVRHHAALAQLLGGLRQVLSRLDRLCDLIDPASPDLDAVVAALFGAHRMLLGLSKPGSGLAPIDFKAACCNCKPKQ